jgi:hypothetical protein
MPDLATMLAARPRCTRDRYAAPPGESNIRRMIPCYGVMHYERDGNRWRCHTCLNAISGETIAAQRTKITTLQDAA